MIVKMVLHGLKSSSVTFKYMLAKAMCNMEHRSSKADPDACLKTATKPNGFRYYMKLLVYSDDVLSISYKLI